MNHRLYVYNAGEGVYALDTHGAVWTSAAVRFPAALELKPEDAGKHERLVKAVVSKNYTDWDAGESALPDAWEPARRVRESWLRLTRVCREYRQPLPEQIKVYRGKNSAGHSLYLTGGGGGGLRHPHAPL